MKNILGLSTAAALCAAIALTAGATKLSYKPEVGYVPNEETAIAIALAVWAPIYGKDNLEKERPFHARLKKGVWAVKGTGEGAAEADIAKDDGRILRVIHLR